MAGADGSVGCGRVSRGAGGPALSRLAEARLIIGGYCASRGLVTARGIPVHRSRRWRRGRQTAFSSVPEPPYCITPSFILSRLYVSIAKRWPLLIAWKTHLARLGPRFD